MSYKPRRLTVYREPHVRKGYYKTIHGKRVRIPGTRVKGARFKIRDVGAPGRGKKVIKIKRPGLLTSVSKQVSGDSKAKYFSLSDSERQEVLERLKDRGYSEQQIKGMVGTQLVWRRRMPDGVKEKAEKDISFVTKKLFPP